MTVTNTITGNIMKGLIYLIIFSTIFNFAEVCLAQDYQIGEGDLLKISVYDNPDLEKTVRVSNEGIIILPLIGHVSAKGQTEASLSKRISEQLADGFLVDPHVSVFVQEFRAQKVTILGEINSPGLYEISGDISFLELVSKAGGFTQLAGNAAVIKRQPADTQKHKKIIQIDLKNFMEKGDTSVDVSLKHGDAIFVKIADMFYVNGEVKNSDVYKYKENMTVIKAITMANGFTEKASSTNIKIIRKVNGNAKIFEKVNMDMPVLPEDIIVVPESFF